ncbi:MAG: DUF2892 domain-containing protein [Pseudomonadota bacterium]
MGRVDRGGRLVIAAALGYLALATGMATGALFWLALAVAVIFTVTAVLSNCPFYRIVGLKTCRDC